MLCGAGMSGIAGSYINIGAMVCFDDDGKLVPMLPSHKGPIEGFAARDIAEGEHFRPVGTGPFPVVLRNDSMTYLSETKETDQWHTP